jgi:hypothetical protein
VQHILGVLLKTWGRRLHSCKTKLVYTGLIFKPDFELVLEGLAHVRAVLCLAPVRFVSVFHEFSIHFDLVFFGCPHAFVVHFPQDNMKVLLQGYATTQQYTLIFTRIDIHIIFHSWCNFLNFVSFFTPILFTS